MPRHAGAVARVCSRCVKLPVCISVAQEAEVVTKEAAERMSRVDGLRRQLASLEAATQQLQVASQACPLSSLAQHARS